MNIYAAEVDFSLVLDSNQDGVADSDSVEEGADFDILVYLDLTETIKSTSFLISPDDSSLATISSAASGSLISSATVSPSSVLSTGGYTYGETTAGTATAVGTGQLFATLTATAVGDGSVIFSFDEVSAGRGRIEHTTTSTSSLTVTIIDSSDALIDADGDGYSTTLTTSLAADCDDGDASINPGATEICDMVDNDCDGVIDDADGSTISGQTTWYIDQDSDGFGDPVTTLTACYAVGGYVSDGTDCDDSNSAINPGATEMCDTIDNDCDGDIGDDDSTVSDQTTWYYDGDQDSYGSTSSVLYCLNPSTSTVWYATNSDDCDDSFFSVTNTCSETAAVTGDFDSDGSLGPGDVSLFYAELRSNFGGTASSSEYDLDGSGHIDVGDIRAFISLYYSSQG